MSYQTDKEKVILWARRIVKLDFVVLDTETTGLSPDTGDEAITIGIIDKTGQILLDARIRPTRPISPEAARKHGYHQHLADQFPPFAEVHDELARVLEGRIVVSYCVNGYDRAIIRSTCRNNNLPLIEFYHFEELLYPASTIIGDWNDYFGNYKWQRLDTAAEYFGVEVKGSHDAVADCRMTLGVLKAMAEMPLDSEVS